LKCLEKKPENRYQSAKELALELQHLVRPGDESRLIASRAASASNSVKIIAVLAVAVILAIIVAAVVGMNASTNAVLPHWFLSVINLVVLVEHAATLLAFDSQGAAVRVFAVVLVLRGIVGVTATLGDGAPFAIARWAAALDAVTSTLLSGAFGV